MIKVRKVKENKKIDAYKDRINFIMASKGRKNITPQLILNDAENKKSPLHDYFLWDDGQAAHKWRLEQARQLLRTFVETIQVANKQIEVRSFHSVKVKDKDVYTPLKTVLQNQGYRNQLIDDAQKYVEHFIKILSLLKNIK